MQVVMGRGVAGTKQYAYAVEDVRDGQMHRVLSRVAWAREVPTMECLHSLVKEHGLLVLEPDWETDAHLIAEVPETGVTMLARSFSVRLRGTVLAALVLAPIIVEIVDRLNIIPGF